MTYFLLIQFQSQDVMVPWHLQPKYTPRQGPPSIAQRSKEEKEAKARSKKERKKKKRKELIEERLPVANKSLLEDVGDRLLGPLKELQLDSEDLCPPSATVAVVEESCTDHRNMETRLRKNKDTDGTNVQEKSELGQESLFGQGEERGGRLGQGPELGQGQERAGKLGQEPHGEVEGHERAGRLGQEPVLEEEGQQRARKQGLDQPEKGQTLKEQGYSTYQRYYHVFRQRELAMLVQEVPGVEVKEEYYDHENWCVIAVKTEDLGGNIS